MNPKRTREALAADEEFDGNVSQEHYDSIRDMAAWAVGLFVECENCGSLGCQQCWLGTSSKGSHMLENHSPCPSCGGRGFSLNRERLERALVVNTWTLTHDELVVRIIQAFLLEGPNSD